MGGRVAEEIIFGHEKVTSGASSDIQMATKLAKDMDAKKYFCVSTDKAANPVNMMGASKRIMEMFLMRESLTQNVSMARFANVAFSDGSLLHLSLIHI